MSPSAPAPPSSTSDSPQIVSSAPSAAGIAPPPPSRLSSIRHSGISPSPPASTSSPLHISTSPPYMGPPSQSSSSRNHNRGMTAGEIHNAMEQEQEHITNNLLKHIDQLRADKIRIEHELEAESEAVMNRLARELSNLRARLEAAGISAPIESSTGPGSQTPRSASRSPSRASSLSRRSISGANSPRLNPVIGSSSPGVVPMMSPVQRRDSIELRGRASTVNSVNGINHDAGQPHGLERAIESLKLENGDLKKSLRELDDRYRCKQAECERQKDEITSLRMEISLLQRRGSTAGSLPSAPPSVIALEERPVVAADSPTSNRATCGSPEDTKRSELVTTTTGAKPKKEETT